MIGPKIFHQEAKQPAVTHLSPRGKVGTNQNNMAVIETANIFWPAVVTLLGCIKMGNYF